MAGRKISLLHSKDPRAVQRTTTEKQALLVRIDEDFGAWLVDQANALRQRRTLSVDWDHLAEELEDMYAHLKRDLASDLRILLEHLLKLQFESKKSYWQVKSRGWKVHAIEHRRRILTILEDSGSLRRRFEDFIGEAYPDAVRKTALLMQRRRASFPVECPWTREQVLEPDFFPNPFNLPADE